MEVQERICVPLLNGSWTAALQPRRRGNNKQVGLEPVPPSDFLVNPREPLVSPEYEILAEGRRAEYVADLIRCMLRRSDFLEGLLVADNDGA